MGDADGLPVDFKITGLRALAGDKGHDSMSLHQQIEAQSSPPAIPRRRNAKSGQAMTIRTAGSIATAIGSKTRLRDSNTIARSRFDTLQNHAAGVIAMACALPWLPV